MFSAVEFSCADCSARFRHCARCAPKPTAPNAPPGQRRAWSRPGFSL